MSLAAMNYVMELREFPDGVPLDTTDKAVAFVLAHHHNPSTRVTYPNRDTIAAAACCSVPTVKRALRSFERHLFVRRIRPENQGRGQFTLYRFLALDEPELLARLLSGERVSDREGGQIDPLFSVAERGSEGGHLDPKRGSEGGHPRSRNKERTGTKTNYELNDDDDCRLPVENVKTQKPEINREQLREVMEGWLGIDNGRQQAVSVDDLVLNRLIERCIENDAAVTTEEIMHFLNEKGPSLLIRRENYSTGGWVSERKPGIKYPAMFLVAAVASCFEGANSASRRMRSGDGCTQHRKDDNNDAQ